jgi:hypothetical protein
MLKGGHWFCDECCEEESSKSARDQRRRAAALAAAFFASVPQSEDGPYLAIANTLEFANSEHPAEPG